MSVTQINAYLVQYDIITNLEAQAGGQVEGSPVTTLVLAQTDSALAGVITAGLTLGANQSVNILNFTQLSYDGNVYQ